MLERELPEGAFILGVDSHTALVLDLEAHTASVAGLGGVTIRAAGRSSVIPAGREVSIEALGAVATELALGDTTGAERDLREAGAGPHGSRDGRASSALPLRDTAAQLEGTCIDGLHRGDIEAAVGALLELDLAIAARVRAGEDSPELDSASGTFRSLIARLGERAVAGTTDPRTTVGPFVATLLEVRGRARAAQDWETADFIRDQLAAAGVEVRDGAGGSRWTMEHPIR